MATGSMVIRCSKEETLQHLNRLKEEIEVIIIQVKGL